MNTEDRAQMRLRAISIAQEILNAKLMTLSAQSNWATVAPTTEEVISEAAKLLAFIEG
jgi:hypothetical protein